jgi:hypothetical protein
VRRVAQALGLFDALVHEDVVLDHDEPLRDACHLGDRLADVLKMVCGDPAGDDVEAPVLERQFFRARDDIGLHARSGIDGDDGATFVAQPPRHVAAPGCDVEHLAVSPGLAPLDEQVEVRAFPMCRALTERAGALRPDVGHAASSTARCAASSMVGST